MRFSASIDILSAQKGQTILPADVFVPQNIGLLKRWGAYSAPRDSALASCGRGGEGRREGRGKGKGREGIRERRGKGRQGGGEGLREGKGRDKGWPQVGSIDPAEL